MAISVIRNAPPTYEPTEEQKHDVAPRKRHRRRMLQPGTSLLFCEETIRESKLARYSAKFWIRHAQAAGQGAEALNRLIMELFLLRGSAHLNSVRIHDVDLPSKGTDITRTINEVSSPLYYASLCGFTEIVELLINATGAEVNTQGGARPQADRRAAAESGRRRQHAK